MLYGISKTKHELKLTENSTAMTRKPFFFQSTNLPPSRQPAASALSAAEISSALKKEQNIKDKIQRSLS